MNLKIHACVGGTAVRDDIRTLQDGVHIVVGTPGRVYDMIQRRALRLESVQLFVLDEGTFAFITCKFIHSHTVHVIAPFSHVIMTLLSRHYQCLNAGSYNYLKLIIYTHEHTGGHTYIHTHIDR